MSMFLAPVIFTINEKQKYSYKTILTCYKDIISFKKSSKNHKIKSSTYRRWARKQKELLNQKGRRAQRQIQHKISFQKDFQERTIRPKPIKRKVILTCKPNISKPKRSKPIKINKVCPMNLAYIYNRELKKFVSSRSYY